MQFSFFFFCKFSYLDQFYSFTLAIILYHFLPQCLSVTRAISQVSPFSIFTKEFLYSFHFFCKFSYLEQFYSFTCTIHLYRFFTTMFIRHTRNSLGFSPQYFYQKNFVQFSFCFKFSYLDQFYSFTLAILLYHFLPQCSSVTRANFLSFFLCIFYRNKFSLMRTPI